MTTYRYTINGTAAGGQTWETTGEIEALPGNLPDVLQLAMAESFMKLTRGEAVFGHPGVGCSGPYAVARFLVEALNQ
jgi:hypothetical protein